MGHSYHWQNMEQFFLLRNESSGIIEPDREQIDPTYTHTSWQIDGETMKTVTDFIFLGSKITADGDCRHEIKRHFLLGRKARINLDSILKSRDITLLRKVHIDKTMWCWRRLLRAPWTARRSNQFILKEISPGCSLEGMMLKDRKSTRLNSSHSQRSRMPSSA